MCRISLLLAAALSISPPALAGPGHDHSHEAAPNVGSRELPRLESAGSELEMVAVAQGQTLTIYLDQHDTNEPVNGATIEVSGENMEAQMAAAVGDGVYELEAEWVGQPGSKALTFLVSAEESVDLLNGTIEVPSASTGDHAGPVTWSAILLLPAFWIVLVLSVLFGFVTAFAFRPIRVPPEGEPAEEAPSKPQLSVIGREHVARIILVACSLEVLLPAAATADTGHDHSHEITDSSPAGGGGDEPRKLPNGEVFMPKVSQRALHVRTLVSKESDARAAAEYAGTVIADPTSEGRVQSPMDGKIELAGGQVSFVGQKVQAGDLLALLSPTMPVYERGYLEQLTADVVGKMRIAEQRLRRLENISKGYVPQKDIEDTRVELDSLKEQKRLLEPKSGQKIELTAPVAGIIAEANVRAGHVVNTGDTLFQIVDPNRLWVELVGAPGMELEPGEKATAVTMTGRVVPLSYAGRSPVLRDQIRHLYFKVGDARGSLAIGEIIKVAVPTGETLTGIMLPRDAVVRGPNGLAYIWEKVSAERFKPVAVRMLPLDGSNVVVTAGLETGRRVVVEGAEFVNQVR